MILPRRLAAARTMLTALAVKAMASPALPKPARPPPLSNFAQANATRWPVM